MLAGADRLLSNGARPCRLYDSECDRTLRWSTIDLMPPAASCHRRCQVQATAGPRHGLRSLPKAQLNRPDSMRVYPAVSLWILVVTALTLFWVALTDLREFKVRNELVVILACLYVALRPRLGRLGYMQWNFAFALVMLAAGLYAYSVHHIGGGDLKLLTVAFLWTGPWLAAPFVVLLLIFTFLYYVAARIGFVAAQRTSAGLRIPASGAAGWGAHRRICSGSYPSARLKRSSRPAALGLKQSGRQRLVQSKPLFRNPGSNQTDRRDHCDQEDSKQYGVFYQSSAVFVFQKLPENLQYFGHRLHLSDLPFFEVARSWAARRPSRPWSYNYPLGKGMVNIKQSQAPARTLAKNVVLSVDRGHQRRLDRYYLPFASMWHKSRQTLLSGRLN